MKCPGCGGMESEVRESRLRAGGTRRYRQHWCKSCGERFDTSEHYVPMDPDPDAPRLALADCIMGAHRKLFPDLYSTHEEEK